jgi:mRNA interferase MazF
MNEGDVVLSPLPQADGWAKNRPCVALRRMPGFGDWLVCGISTQLRQEVPGFDEAVRPWDPDFSASGLKAASLIRLGFRAVLPEDRLLGAIGALAPERHQRLLGRLSAYLTQAAG